jgi:hypothetical protein
MVASNHLYISLVPTHCTMRKQMYLYLNEDVALSLDFCPVLPVDLCGVLSCVCRCVCVCESISMAGNNHAANDADDLNQASNAGH